MKIPPVTLSHARSLRVIGQCLQDLGVERFALDKSGPGHVVWIAIDQALHVEAPLSPSLAVCFNGANLEQLDLAGRLRREKWIATPQIRNLSSNLRAIGDYLDRKGAVDFSLSWSKDLAKVDFAGVQESFSIHQNLYDLGLCMFSKRSRQSEFAPPLPAEPAVLRKNRHSPLDGLRTNG